MMDWSPNAIKVRVELHVKDQRTHHESLHAVYNLRRAGEHSVADWKACPARSCGMVQQSMLNMLAEARMEQVAAITNLSLFLCGHHAL